MRADAVHRKSTLCLQHTLKTDLKKKSGLTEDRGGLVTDRKPRFTQSRLHTLNTDTHRHTQSYTFFST